ncbi:MAG: hypothetical protein IJ475_00280 [Bacilli bacterium]|nr:hypothetical protein [Bacilli bacterium]
MSKSGQSNKNKKFVKSSRRLLLLILFFVFLLLTFGVFTYSWFSSNKNALIDTIDINVATVTGLQVSVDAINWANEVSREELENAINTYSGAENQFPDTLAGVSTDGSVSNGKLNMYYGITTEDSDGEYSLTTVKQTEKNCVGDEECEHRHYVAYDLFLLVTTPADIAITANSGIGPQEDAEDKGSQNAARIGFVVLGTVDANASAYAAQSIKSGRTSYIWEPNYDMHTEHAVKAAKKYYNIDTTTSGGARLPYKGVNQEFSSSVRLDQTGNSPYFTTVTPDIATISGFTNNQALMRIPAGITKVRVYLWLEGQDVDMENYAASSKLKFDLELAMVS